MARPQDTLKVGNFSVAAEGNELPSEWKPLTFDNVERHTDYALVEEDGEVVIKAVSENAASGLIRKVDIDLKQYPVITWRWKVNNILEKGNVNSKAGDDYPARIYVTFAYDPDKLSFTERLKYRAGRALFGDDLPSSAINYIWANKASKGTITDNAYTGFVKMIVVESGKENMGEWIKEERNIYQDYIRAFGEEPPMITGVAIMTDTDNTGESATAYYGDITFKPE